MPRFNVPIANTYDSIARPTYLHLAKEVMAICNLDMNNTGLYLPGERGVTNQPGTAETEKDQVRYGNEQRVLCEVSDVIRHNQLLTTKTRTRDQMPVIFDDSLKLIISPVYVQSDLEFRFTYVADTKHRAMQWRENMAIRIAEAHHANQHVIKYSLTFNPIFLNLIRTVHAYKENIAGYGESLEDYFKRIQVRELIAKGTLDGDLDKSVFQIEEQQAHIAGYFETGDLPQERREDGNTTYEVEFTYKISYLKPTHWCLEYPISVHQQHLPVDYVNMNPIYTLDDYDIGLSDPSWQAFERIRWRSIGKGNVQRGGLRYPYYDEWWKPEDNVPWSLPVITWLLALDPNYPQHLLDINDIPDMDFTPNMIQYMKDHHQTLSQPNKALCYFVLYENDEPLDGSMIEVDENLRVRAKKPLSMRSVYHLRFSLRTSLEYLPQDTVNNASNYPGAVLEMAQTVLPDLDVEYAMEYQVDHDFNTIDRGYMRWVYDDMVLKGIGKGAGSKFYNVHDRTQARYVTSMTSIRSLPAPVYNPVELDTYINTIEREGFREHGEFAFDDGKYDNLVVNPPSVLKDKRYVPYPLYNNLDRTVQFLSVFAKKR